MTIDYSAEPGPEAPRAAIAPPPELPSPPREMTPLAAKIAFGEPRVRCWLILTVLFVVITLSFAVSKLSMWASDRSLVISGTPTEAIVTWAGGDATTGQRKPWDNRINLEFTVGNQPIVVENTQLQERTPEGLVTIGGKVSIRYDKANPQRWTNRTVPPSAASVLIAVYITALFTVVAAGVWAIQRARVLKTWREGKLTAGGVVRVTSSPIAPGHAYTVVSLHNQDNVTVYVPKSMSNPVRGDLVWLLVTPGGMPLAARMFL